MRGLVWHPSDTGLPISFNHCSSSTTAPPPLDMFISAIFIQTILSAAALAVYVGTSEQSAFIVGGVTASHEAAAAVAPPAFRFTDAGAGIAGVEVSALSLETLDTSIAH